MENIINYKLSAMSTFAKVARYSWPLLFIKEIYDIMVKYISKNIV